LAIRAVVFDIGGVLEIAPRTGWEAKWEQTLGLKPGELAKQLYTIWKAGSIGTITIEQVEKSTGEILGLDKAQLGAFMNDLWDEYLGTLNTELAAYFANLRPRYKTAILSNSFVGAREKEHQRYGFGDICDLIIYSHDVGLQKPDRAVYELLCERLGLQPQEIVFVDDVDVCVEAARAIGIHGIQFKETAQAIVEIEACLKVNAQPA